ncbi:protein translocase subunit SecF [Patescibacteria group bacterium]
MYQIINKRKYTYIISIALIFLSAFALGKWGLKLGIDFQGGTLMEVEFSSDAKTQDVQKTKNELGQEVTISQETTQEGIEVDIPTSQEVQDSLAELELNSLTVQQSGENRAIIRYIESSEDTNEKVLEKIRELNVNTKQVRVDFIGASISSQLKDNALKALFFAVLGIALYIAWAFRKVSYPVPSWQYGLGAILALAHDIILTLGVFSFLGHFYDIEVGVPFIAALLTILGYSVNDTIVIFDRTRENILRSGNNMNFEELVNRSLNESLSRSINTSLTVAVVLLAIILFGGVTIKYFAVALLAGIIFGTYSSMYVASALLVTSHELKIKQK